MRIPRHILLYYHLSSRDLLSCSVSDLNNSLDDKMSWATLFKAIDELERRGVITTRKEGTVRTIYKTEKFFLVKSFYLGLYDACLDELPVEKKENDTL